MMKGLIFQQQQHHVVEDNISNLTSASGDQVSVSSDNRPMFPHLSPPTQAQPQSQAQQPKKKRNLPGNPDPDAEVIALSPKSLMATNRFVCDICNKGFQRDQNLQLHRRGHNLPWKLKQRTSKEIRKKVYVCPERSCVHHDPSKALGDLTGIKKHFCRKHGEKKWKCDKCSKLYAVRSDLKAHSKTCGTREYRCDCGTLFSRRDSYISHRALCDALAQESARSMNGNINPFLSSQPGSSSTSHINLQIQPQFETSHGHGMQAFSLKKEPQTFDFKPEVPQWLAFQQEFRSGPSPGPGPSPIFSTRFDEQNLSANHEGRNPNPNDLGMHCLPPYQYPTPNNPLISATSILQKATQMGATMSNSSKSSSPSSVPAMFQGPHQLHVSAESSNNNSNLFGLNMASREDLATGFLYNFGNKAAASTATGTSGPSSTLLQDMMTSLSSSSGFEGSTFEDAFGGFLNPKRDDVTDHLHETLSRTNSHQFSRADQEGGGTGGGGGGRYDGMTRDFLGLRPLAHGDFFDIAGLSNCMNGSSVEHQNQNQKPWQD